MALTIQELEKKIKSVVEDALNRDFEEVKKSNIEQIKQALKEEMAVKRELSTGEKGQKLGAFVRSLIAGKGNIEAAAKFAKDFLKDEEVAKSLNLTIYEDGGVLAPYEYSSELIELLRPLTAVRRLGARTIPLVGGMIMPRQTAGANAYYIGEEGEVNASNLSFGDLKFEEKELMAVVPISNKLIRVAGNSANQVVTNDLTLGFAVKSDATFIRGTGTQYSPKGLRYWAHSDNVFSVITDSDVLTEVDKTLTQAIYKLKAADIPMIQPGWIISPRTEVFLWRLKDGNGNYVYKDEMRAGLLWGMPYVATTQIPDNLGAGGNESEIYFADFAQVLIAEASQIGFSVSTEASYKDASGNLVSAFSKDQTVVRAKAIHDFGVRHDKAVAVITGVTWGA